MSSLLIEAEGLQRRFDARLAVDALSFTLAPGQVLALLGPNGAGKTTSMRMLAGLLAPHGGRATIDGLPLDADADHLSQIRRRCGVMPEAPGFYERLSAADNLRFFAGLQRIPRKLLELRIKEELQRFDLADRAQDRVASYSRGMRQRLSIARALLHRPKLLFLDEPTAGLDPRATADLHRRIGELRAQGVGIVLSTHLLEEAEALADNVLLLDTRPLFFGPVSELQTGQRLIDVQLHAPFSTGFQPPAGISLQQQDAQTLCFAVEQEARDVPELIAALVANGARIRAVNPRRQSLREIYLQRVPPR